MTLFQNRDPLVGVLDYIAEVRPLGYDCLLDCAERVPKEMSDGQCRRGYPSHCSL